MFSVLVIASRVFCMMAKRPPRPLVLCGPSGSGKSTLLKRLFAEYPNTFGFSVSHTTRNPREGEEDGVHYYFVNRETMEKLMSEGEFIETATFTGNIYGTSKSAIESVQKLGKVCILDIEPQGVEQIKLTSFNPILIYNNPPSLKALEERLRKRNTETEDSLQRRLHAAQFEIEYGLKPGNFHKIIYNDDIDEAYREFRDFVMSELKAQEAKGTHICW